MPANQVPLRAGLLIAVFAIASASSIPPYALFARDTCPADYDQCSSSGLPDFFCCPSGQTCLSLAGKTTALCCPEGSDCAKIRPITCDVTMQDAKKNPKNLVKTTALNAKLPECGRGCCPFGYTCNDKDECIKDKDQTKSPAASTTASTTSATATSTSTKSSSSSASASKGKETSSADAKESEEAAPGGSTFPAGIVGGVVGGLLGAIVIGILIWCVMIRRRNKQNKEKNKRSSSFGNIISNPIMQGPVMRSDFAAGGMPPPNRDDATGSRTLSSMFGDEQYERGHSRDPSPRGTRYDADDVYSVASHAPLNRTRNSSIAHGGGTPYPEHSGMPDRNSGTEEISIYVEGNDTPRTRHDSTQTTFTSIMRGADQQHDSFPPPLNLRR